MEPRGREPWWALVLVGWMALGAARQAGWWSPTWNAREAPAVAVDDAPEASNDIERMSARELRRLPGLGEVRALALVRDRWRRRSTGEPLDLEGLPGIGPKTAQRIREASGAP